MDRVKIPSARNRLNDYPHEFSGGMCQRVMIATALALEPRILIADEPTAALDVTVQRQIMALLAELKEELGMALVLVTHDLGVVAEVVDRAHGDVCWPHCGKRGCRNIVRRARAPLHPRLDPLDAQNRGRCRSPFRH